MGRPYYPGSGFSVRGEIGSRLRDPDYASLVSLPCTETTILNILKNIAMKHSEGTWIIRGRNAADHIMIGKSPNNTLTYAYACYISEERTEEQEANAKLIAAAPTMLQTLLEIKADMESHYLLKNTFMYGKVVEAIDLAISPL
jgi:hypothetical protein